MKTQSGKYSSSKVGKGFFTSIAQGGLVGLYESFADRNKKSPEKDDSKEREPILKSTFKKAIDVGEKGLIGHGIREGASLLSKNLGKHRFAKAIQSRAGMSIISGGINQVSILLKYRKNELDDEGLKKETVGNIGSTVGWHFGARVGAVGLSFLPGGVFIGTLVGGYVGSKLAERNAVDFVFRREDKE